MAREQLYFTKQSSWNKLLCISKEFFSFTKSLYIWYCIMARGERSLMFRNPQHTFWRVLTNTLSAGHASGINSVLRHTYDAAATVDLIVACNKLVSSNFILYYTVQYMYFSLSQVSILVHFCQCSQFRWKTYKTGATKHDMRKWPMVSFLL